MPYIDKQRLSETPVNFIIGSPRSGTTLLTTILNANSEVLCLPETKFILTFYQKFAHQHPINPFFADTFSNYTALRYQKLNQRQEVLLWDYDKDVYLKFDAQKLKDLTYAELMTLLLLNMGMKSKDNNAVKLVVDKEPDYTFWVKTLLSIYPNAKFLVAMRDYRSVVLSKKESGRRIKNVSFHAYEWLKYGEAILSLQQQYPDKIKLIYYEQMVLNTEQQVKEICSFFNLTYDVSMLKPHEKIHIQQENLQQNVGDRDQKRIGDLIKPINTSRLEAWKNKLSASEIADIESICGKVGNKFGYQPTTNLSRSNQIKVWLINMPYLILSMLYHYLLNNFYYYLPFTWRKWGVKYLGFGR
jgi:hypothetical protein